jgi:hypothetical protein
LISGRVAGPRVAWALALLAIATALVQTASADASTGVSIDVGAIAIREPLAPGGEYRLPPFGVRNPGTDPTSYLIVVSYVDGQTTLRPSQDWFSFSPARLTLEAGGSQPVSTTLRLPAGAEPGEYSALVGPQVINEGTGAQVGAGAAARLTFTVEPSSALDAFLRWLFRVLGEQPWLWIGALVVLLLGILALLRRRFRLTISRRP